MPTKYWVLQGLAIDAGGIAIFGFLLKRDLDARDKQIARMSREEDLGSLQIELANKKTLRLAQLRQFARIVGYPSLICHTRSYLSCITAVHVSAEYRCVGCVGLIQIGWMQSVHPCACCLLAVCSH